MPHFEVAVYLQRGGQAVCMIMTKIMIMIMIMEVCPANGREGRCAEGPTGQANTLCGIVPMLAF